MTLIVGNIQDVGYDGINGTLRVWAGFRPEATTLIAPVRREWAITNGQIADGVDIMPGPVQIQIEAGLNALKTVPAVIPDAESVTIQDLFLQRHVWTPTVVTEVAALTLRAEAAVGSAEAAAERAEDAATNVDEAIAGAADQVVQAVEQDRVLAEQAAGTATSAASQTAADRSHVDIVREELDQAYADSDAGQAMPPRLTEAALNATYDQIDVAPSGTLETDIARVTAAALAAKNAGRKSVRMAPGHYLLDGVTVADVHDRYLVGDNVTFSQDSWVYPFKSSDLAARSAASASTGGRGRIAIEFDDGLLSHWRMVFPLTKELGITMGTAWHTDNGAQWIAEAYRHGWEILAHLPENITATVYRDLGQLDAAAQSSLSKIKEQIGTDQGIGFVYPQHVRDEDTDRILSKYFTYGRGLSSQKIYAPDKGHEWLTSSVRLDLRMSLDGVDDMIVRLLDQVAASNGGMVFYFHHDPSRHDVAEAGLRDLVAKCRERGISIVNPSQIAATWRLPVDTYLENLSPAAIEASTTTLSTERAYHGDNSMKTGPTGGRWMGPYPTILPSRPGMFGVFRVSVRRSHDADIEITSPGQGIRFAFNRWKRKLSDPNLSASPGGFLYGNTFPYEGTTIPASDWARHGELVYFPPDVEAVTPTVTVQNLVEGSDPMWLDEFLIQHVDWSSQLVLDATLSGTNNVFVWCGVIGLGEQVINVVPSQTPVGTITATPSSSSGRILLKSTDPGDTMPVKIIVTPAGLSYDDVDTISGDGA